MAMVNLIAVLALPAAACGFVAPRSGGACAAPRGARAARPRVAMRERPIPSSFKDSELSILEHTWPAPVLRGPCEPVADFDDALRALLAEMMTVMYQAEGVGLAAPQVGLRRQIFVYNPTGDRKIFFEQHAVCNPRIVAYSDATDVDEEGCLSSLAAACAGLVERATTIEVPRARRDAVSLARAETGGRGRGRSRGKYP